MPSDLEKSAELAGMDYYPAEEPGPIPWWGVLIIVLAAFALGGALYHLIYPGWVP
jgi:hypothetical protein